MRHGGAIVGGVPSFPLPWTVVAGYPTQQPLHRTNWQSQSIVALQQKFTSSVAPQINPSRILERPPINIH